MNESNLKSRGIAMVDMRFPPLKPEPLLEEEPPSATQGSVEQRRRLRRALA